MKTEEKEVFWEFRSDRKKQVRESIGWGTQIGKKKLRNLWVGNSRKLDF